MSDKKQETIEDIVAEMREYESTPPPRDAWLDLADRIEEEVKRERGAEAAQICGNAAKIREALSDACYAMHNFLKTQYGGYEEMAKALDKAKAALSAPPRNCDIYDAESCRMAYHLHGDGLMTMQAFADWLFAPAEEGAAS